MQKNQLYEQLDLKLINKQGKHVSECILALTTKRGEINNLICHSIDLYSKFYMSRNLWLVSYLKNCIQTISGICRQKINDNNLFKKSICDLFLVFLTQKYEPHVFFRKDRNMSNPENLIRIINEFNDNVGMHESITSVTKEKGNDDFSKLLNEEMCVYLKMLVYSVRNKDKKSVTKILDFLLSCDISLNNEIDYTEISMIKPQFRADIVWYLWKLLLRHIASCKEEKEFCKTHMFLYTFCYQKRHRVQRLNMLYFCFLILASKKKNPLKYKEKSVPFSVKDIIQVVPPDTQSSPVPKDNSSKSKSKKIKAVTSRQTHDEKPSVKSMDYLKYIVYKNSD